MAYRVLVQLKKGSDVTGPWRDERAEAEDELGKIRQVVGSSNLKKASTGVPDLPWLVAQGHNIASASVVEGADPAGPYMA